MLFRSRLLERDNYSYHRDKMHANLAVSMGGRVAEEIIFGYDKVSSGASGDIQYATKLARDMVTQWVMSDLMGPLHYEEEQGETFLGYSHSQRVHMSDATAKKIDLEIRKPLDDSYDRAKHLLTTYEDQLHALADALLEYETLSGEEIDELVKTGKYERPDGGVIKPAAVPTIGTSIPKAGRKKKGPFGDPEPQGA